MKDTSMTELWQARAGRPTNGVGDERVAQLAPELRGASCAAPARCSEIGASSPGARGQKWGRNRQGASLLLALVLVLALASPAESRLAESSGGLRRPQLTRRQTADAIATGAGPASENSASSLEDSPAAPASTEDSASSGPAPATSTEPPPPAQPQARARIGPVNFTLIDELFAAPAEPADMVAKWRAMDRTLQASVGALLKLVFPQVVSLASDAKVSGNCQGAILKWILNLKQLRAWSVRMLDAIGKPGAGLLEGQLTLFGNYRQCLSVRAPDEDEIELAEGAFKEYFRGQYCVLQIKPPLVRKQPFYSLNSTLASLNRQPAYKYYEKSAYDELAELAMAFNFVSIRADLCVPSLCSRDDLQRVASFLAGKLNMRARVQRCDVAPQEDQWQLEQHHLAWSLVVASVLLLVLVSTLASLALGWRNASSKSKRRSLFTSMSVYRSLAHMRNVQLDRINDSKPALLYSIRLLLILWLALVGLIEQLNFQFLRELLSLRSLIMLWPMQLLVNSSLAYDSLILLTAFTYAYQNINANLRDLVRYNVSKYARLMPSIMLLVALTIVTPLLSQSRSPVWRDFVDEPAQACRSNGLLNLVFLQNFLPSQAAVCLPQTWLLCVELQLCLLSIPLVYSLNKTFDLHQGRFKPRSTPILILLALALLGCLLNFANIYQNSLPAAWFLTFPDRDDRDLYWSLHLTKTWTHLSTFAVGLMAGHLCRCQTIESFSGKPYGRRCCNNLMWFVSALTMLSLLLGTHQWSLSGTSHLEAPLQSALYGALAPLLWSISLALILFQLTVPDHKDCRSSLANLLTGDINLIRLGRLSFLAYLLNPYVNMLVLALQEQAVFSSSLMLAHTFLGNLVLTFALAFLVSALVELPCRRLAKKLLGARRHCSHLDIIARQLNIRHQNQGPSHDSFVAGQQKQSYASAGQPQSQLQPAATQMIPLK